MNWLSQVVTITGVTLRSLGQRLGSSIVAIIGIAGVVIVSIAVLSIAEGFRAAMTEAGDPETVIVMRAASDTEMTSNISGDEARIIENAPGVKIGPDGPTASAELFVIVNHPMRRSGTDANVPLRGVSPAVLQVRDEVKIVEGRMFELGRNEIIVGRAASRQFVGLDVGTDVRWGENTWRVVGIFEAGGAASESELWCDVKVLQPAYRRGNSYNSMYVKLTSADAFQPLKDALTTDPRLNVMVVRENDYFAEQGIMLQAIIRSVGFGIAFLMGLGAVFGAVNTMYTAVCRPHARDRDPPRAGLRQRSGRRLRPGRGRALERRRRAARRRPGVDGVRRLPDRDDELAVVQPGRVRVQGHAVATRQGHALRRHHGAHRRVVPGDPRRPHAGRHGAHGNSRQF